MSYRRNNSPPVLGGCAGFFIAVFLIIVLLTAGKAFAVQPCWSEVTPSGQECELTEQEMYEVTHAPEQSLEEYEAEAKQFPFEPEQETEPDSPPVAEVSSVASQPTTAQGMAATPPVRVPAGVRRPVRHVHHARHASRSRRAGKGSARRRPVR